VGRGGRRSAGIIGASGWTLPNLYYRSAVEELGPFVGEAHAATRQRRPCATPDRILAAASIYGVALMTDKPDSPHLAPQHTNARLYFGCAETDPYAPGEMIDALRTGLEANRANAEVEIYPGTQHGFAFPQRPG